MVVTGLGMCVFWFALLGSAGLLRPVVGRFSQQDRRSISDAYASTVLGDRPFRQVRTRERVSSYDVHYGYGCRGFVHQKSHTEKGRVHRNDLLLT